MLPYQSRPHITPFVLGCQGVSVLFCARVLCPPVQVGTQTLPFAAGSAAGLFLILLRHRDVHSIRAAVLVAMVFPTWYFRCCSTLLSVVVSLLHHTRSSVSMARDREPLF